MINSAKNCRFCFLEMSFNLQLWRKDPVFVVSKAAKTEQIHHVPAISVICYSRGVSLHPQSLPIAGTAMPILDTTTWAMACLAALGDSPNLFPFSSVIGIPYFNSLGEGEWQKSEWGQLLEGLINGGGGLGPHLCLMKGMLIQLAAATAAKGTKRLTIGGRCCKEREWIRRGKKTKMFAVTHTRVFYFSSHEPLEIP